MLTDGPVPDDGLAAPAEDIAWWVEKAATLRWTWAYTYRKFAPHWYVTASVDRPPLTPDGLGQRHTPGMSLDDYLRAGKVIRTFGEPGKYHSLTNLYLVPGDGYRYWCMWTSPPQPGWCDTLINRADEAQVYGPQDNFDEYRLAELRLPGQPETLF